MVGLTKGLVLQFSGPLRPNHKVNLETWKNVLCTLRKLPGPLGQEVGWWTSHPRLVSSFFEGSPKVAGFDPQKTCIVKCNNVAEVKTRHIGIQFPGPFSRRLWWTNGCSMMQPSRVPSPGISWDFVYGNLGGPKKIRCIDFGHGATVSLPREGVWKYAAPCNLDNLGPPRWTRLVWAASLH